MNKSGRPERTCVGCGARRAKGEMVRVCRDPDGNVFVDGTGRSPGRGCYVCPDASCSESARRKRSISRSLKGDVPENVYKELGRAAELRSGAE
jgi:uncharacterized protein